MNTSLLHSALMQRAILANCGSVNYFSMPDQESVNGSRLVDREEYSRIMLGFANYIAQNCPQLFNALPLYMTYVTSPLTEKTVSEFLGQSLKVNTTSICQEDDVYCRQTIAISDEMKLDLVYTYSRGTIGEVYCKSVLQEKLEVRTMTELCDIIQRYSGEVVMIDD